MNPGFKWIAGTAAALMLSLLLLIVLGDNGLVELSRLRAQQRTLAETNETLARENVSLYHTIDRLKHDRVYIETVARTELGMVGTNDLVIIRPDGGRQRK